MSHTLGRDRTVTVPADRLVRWVRGFGVRHGCLIAEPAGTGFDLRAADGSTARISAASAPLPLPPWPPQSPADAGPETVGDRTPEILAVGVAAHLLVERSVALLVIRRGGYAAARLHGCAVVTSKVGTRYVQGRTAAGGWSQQRFARRRDNQTSGLVETAVEVAVRIFAVPGDGPAQGRAPDSGSDSGSGSGLQALVTGGDRALVDRALADPRLRVVARLPRGPHLALGDPRADVVRAVPAMLRSVRITLAETGPQA